MAPPTPGSDLITLLSVTWSPSTLVVSATASYLIVLVVAVMPLAVALWRHTGWGFRAFEIDQAEIGVGNSKFRFRPNNADRQIAYAIWVELSTRKLGLDIDFEHDVIAEIYDSWYTFFSVTRELVKAVPVTQVKRGSTQAIIRLSIEVLNEGLRPHLTHWQARFRSWYDREVKKYDQAKGGETMDPQQIQRSFPQFEALKTDMERVNGVLKRYRAKMHELVLKN